MSQDIWMHMLQRTEDAPGDRCTAARCRVNTDRSFKRARTGGSGCRRRGGGRRDYDITEIDITESDVAEFDITENDITESDITETNIT